MSPDMDIAVSTEPGCSFVQSGGSGEYADNAGDTIGGVERLGILGTG